MGRNVDVGNSAAAGLVRTYGCPDKVGLSDRVRVVGELALVQPSIAIDVANTRTNDQRMAMLSILTSSPEGESREISPGGVREPSGRLRPPRPGRAVIVRTVGRESRYCSASCRDIRLKQALQACTGFWSPARAFLSGSCGRFRRSWRRRASETRGSIWRNCNQPQPRSWLPPGPLPFLMRPHDFFRSRFTMSSEAVFCR